MSVGMVGTLNYTSETRTYKDMQNNLFGVYDITNDRSNYLRNSTDNQYNDNKRLGALLNLALLSKSGNNKYELKNIFNRIDNNRYTDRSGVNAQSDNEIGAEYYYRSRTTTNTIIELETTPSLTRASRRSFLEIPAFKAAAFTSSQSFTPPAKNAFNHASVLSTIFSPFWCW